MEQDGDIEKLKRLAGPGLLGTPSWLLSSSSLKTKHSVRHIVGAQSTWEGGEEGPAQQAAHVEFTMLEGRWWRFTLSAVCMTLPVPERPHAAPGGALNNHSSPSTL